MAEGPPELSCDGKLDPSFVAATAALLSVP
jgi:hypothetical protein